jgi:hypothetical protein
MTEEREDIQDRTTTEWCGELEARLPALNADQVAWAQKPDQKAWAVGMARYGAGYVWTMAEYGMALQVYDETTFRLLTLVEDDFCYEMASFVRATLESVGLELDMSQVVMRDCPPEPEGGADGQRVEPAPSMEVA